MGLSEFLITFATKYKKHEKDLVLRIISIHLSPVDGEGNPEAPPESFFGKTLFARERTQDLLPVIVYQHKSLIRRRLGNVNMQLQENKATNLALAVTHNDGLLDTTWGDLLRMEADRKDDGAQGLQGGADHRKGAAIAGHRRRIMPTVEPDTLDGATQ